MKVSANRLCSTVIAKVKIVGGRVLHSVNDVGKHFCWSAGFPRQENPFPCLDGRNDSLNSMLARVKACLNLGDRSLFVEFFCHLYLEHGSLARGAFFGS
jgi:hypothetical protein